MNNRT